MTRYLAAAALAAAVAVPATQATAQPFGSDKSCGVGMAMGQGEDKCRFLATADSLGVAGALQSGTWKLSHKVRTTVCTDGVVSGFAITQVTDDQGTGPGPVAEQPDFVPGVVYTLEMTGNGGIFAGGPSTGAPSPTAEEPADDKPEDRTGGKQLGAAC